MLRLEDVCLKLGRFYLRDSRLHVKPGTYLALRGSKGTGETVLLETIAGVHTPTSGRIYIRGEDATRLAPEKRRLGMVYQDYALFPHLTVFDNIAFGLRLKGGPGREIKEGVEDMAAFLEIEPLLKRRPDRLSGGERQRVATARAVAMQPRILLMDEPLAALDLARKQEILPYLERLHDELDIPLLYVSHAPDEMARLADHIVAMEAGRVLASGPLAETLARIDLPIRLGEDAGVVLDAVVAQRDEEWQLVRVDFAGGHLWVRDGGHDLGQPIRVRILARDVSLSLERHEGTSIQNILPGRIQDLAEDGHPALCLVQLKVGESLVVARLTKRSVSLLGLAPGKPIWLQIKAVALIG